MVSSLIHSVLLSFKTRFIQLLFFAPTLSTRQDKRSTSSLKSRASQEFCSSLSGCLCGLVTEGCNCPPRVISGGVGGWEEEVWDKDDRRMGKGNDRNTGRKEGIKDIRRKWMNEWRNKWRNNGSDKERKTKENRSEEKEKRSKRNGKEMT